MASLRTFFIATLVAVFLLSARCFLIAPFVIGMLYKIAPCFGRLTPPIISQMRELLKNSSKFLFHRQTNILTAATIIMATFATSHLVGLLKTRLLIAYFFNTKSYLLDVYYAAFLIPDTVFQLLIIGSLSAAFIPVFTRYLSRHESEAWHLANSVFNIVVLMFISISMIAFFLAVPLSRIIAPGFSPLQISILAPLLRLMLVAQIFFAISGFLTAMIQSHQRFLIPALAPLVYNFGIIFGLVVFSPFIGIYGPAVGAVIGAALHMGIQLPLAVKLGFRPQASLDFRQPGVKEVMVLMPPRAIALGIDQVEQLVAAALASTLVAGSLSLLNVARMLYAIPSSIFGVTIGQAALPILSRQSSDSDKQMFSQTIIETVLQVIFLALPLSMLFIVLRIPIIRLVFGTKSFPWTATLLSGKILGILALSAPFSAAVQVIYRGFYALHNTKTQLWVGAIAAILSTLSALVAVNFLGWGLIGLAIVLSVTTIVETSFLFLLLAKSFHVSQPQKNFLAYNFLLPLVKMVTTAIITGFSLWIPMQLLDRFVFDTTRTVPLLALTGITSTIGLCAYLLLSYLFRVDELKVFLSLLKRLGNLRLILKSTPTPTPVSQSS